MKVSEYDLGGKHNCHSCSSDCKKKCWDFRMVWNDWLEEAVKATVRETVTKVLEEHSSALVSDKTVDEYMKKQGIPYGSRILLMRTMRKKRRENNVYKC